MSKVERRDPIDPPSQSVRVTFLFKASILINDVGDKAKSKMNKRSRGSRNTHSREAKIVIIKDVMFLKQK